MGHAASYRCDVYKASLATVWLFPLLICIILCVVLPVFYFSFWWINSAPWNDIGQFVIWIGRPCTQHLYCLHSRGFLSEWGEVSCKKYSALDKGTIIVFPFRPEHFEPRKVSKGCHVIPFCSIVQYFYSLTISVLSRKTSTWKEGQDNALDTIDTVWCFSGSSNERLCNGDKKWASCELCPRGEYQHLNTALKQQQEQKKQAHSANQTYWPERWLNWISWWRYLPSLNMNYTAAAIRNNIGWSNARFWSTELNIKLILFEIKWSYFC